MATLSDGLSSYRTEQVTGHAGLLSKLQIGDSLYDIKDPAVEQLATLVEARLSTLEGKSWTAVNKGANDAKFATAVTQDSKGAITVTYGTIRDTALADTSASGQVVKGISQTVDGVVSATMGAVAAEDVTLSGVTGISSTDVKSALEELAAADAAIIGTSGDAGSANTIYGAKAYADAAVANLAGTDWAANAKKVSEIIAELENSENANAWSTAVDKLAGMTYTDNGQTVNASSVVDYVEHKIAEVNAANTQGIADLDAVVYGAGSNSTSATSDKVNAATSYTNDTSHNVVIKITEVDGKIDAVDVKTNDIASASALQTLDGAAVKSVNGVSPTNGAVTVYAGDVALSSSDNTTVSGKLTSLDSGKANKAAIATGIINNWSTSYGSETLTWTNTKTSVYIPGTGSL